jgi:hypothetical protein
VEGKKILIFWQIIRILEWYLNSIQVPFQRIRRCVSVDRFRFQIKQCVGASLLFEAGQLPACDGRCRCRDCL